MTHNAMIDVDDRLLAIWFMCVSDTSDWLMGMSRAEQGHIKIAWRMRYYNPDSTDPFDEKDRRNEYSYLVRDPEAIALEKARAIARILAQCAEGPLHELIKGDRSADEFIDEFMRQPWAHSKRIPL